MRSDWAEKRFRCSGGMTKCHLTPATFETKLPESGVLIASTPPLFNKAHFLSHPALVLHVFDYIPHRDGIEA